MHRGVEKGHTGQESLSLYEEAAALYDLKPCYLRLDDIDLHSGTSLVYRREGERFRKAFIETPAVIHNRAIYKGPSANRKIRLLQEQGKLLYNFSNRYGKDEIHRLLGEHPLLSGCQPASLHASLENIERMMHRYNDLILKPVNSSVGRGIMRLRQDVQGWKLLYKAPRTKGRFNEMRLGKKATLPRWLVRRLGRFPYLVQERLPLAEMEGRPLDVRVTVQRGLGGDWGITGIFAKVSAPGMFLSNIAQGGSAYPAEEVLGRVFPPNMASRALASCHALALSVARYLSGRLPLLADLGMDIGITDSGQAYFIECNGRDQRYGFRKAGMHPVWINTYRRPMAFARYLLQEHRL
nr:YheC/YheD family protein [Paenibacillus caui]